MNWNRLMWGVEHRTGKGNPMIISSIWRKEKCVPYPDEPTRPLLFTTRAAARKWCTDGNVAYNARSDFVSRWRFRVVRVREIVRKA